MTTAFPDQPIILDERGTPRFVRNKLVEFLLDKGGLDMNAVVIHMLETKTPQADIDQFYQLIGYSVDGYMELHLVSDAAKDRAIDATEKLMNETGRSS